MAVLTQKRIVLQVEVRLLVTAVPVLQLIQTGIAGPAEISPKVIIVYKIIGYDEF